MIFEYRILPSKDKKIFVHELFGFIVDSGTKFLMKGQEEICVEGYLQKSKSLARLNHLVLAIGKAGIFQRNLI